MKYIFTIVLLTAGCSVFSQDLTGVWRGSFNNSTYLRDDDRRLLLPTDPYKFEVQIAQKGNSFEGVTYSYLTTVFYGKATARGTMNPKNGRVFLEELKLVELRMASGSGACAMTLFMQYSKSGDEEFLEGTYTAMNISDSSRCPGGKVFLRRVVNSDFYKEPMVAKREQEIAQEKKRVSPPVASNNSRVPVAKKPVVKTPVENATTKNTLKKPDPKKNTTVTSTLPKKPPVVTPKKKDPVIVTPRLDNSITKRDSAKAIEKKPAPVIVPKVLSMRDNELVKTIRTDENTITINIYDNGTIDNDTVSVYLDKKLVVSKERLSEKPIVVIVKLDETVNYHELVMVAENLGEIPPNTSLMVVHAGSKQYEVRITSTEQKNAVVAFRYEKESQ